jgi:hypothetical protein
MSWSYRLDSGDPRNAYFYSALISCFLSLTVVITYLLFPRLQGKLFMKIITTISLCDCIANASELLGQPGNDDLCATQAVLQQFFYPASWLWTVILTYLLYSLVAHGKISLAEWKMHLIVWGICIAITVLPLTTSTYGRHANDDNWCWIQVSSHRRGGFPAVVVWDYLTFDCVIYGCFFLMALWSILIFYKLSIQQIVPTETVTSALRTLILYPLVFFVCWFPNTTVLTSGLDAPLGSPRMVLIYCLSTWHGGLTAIIYFSNSSQSRSLWAQFLSKHCCCLSYFVGATAATEEKPSLSVRWTVPGASPGVANPPSDPPIISPAEDFESDDAYYGRSTVNPILPTNSLMSSTRPDSIIALSDLNGSMYRRWY